MGHDVPFRGWVGRIERIFEFDDLSVLFFQFILVLGVMLHEFGQRRKLLASVQVVEVALILNLDVCDVILTSKIRV